MKIFLKQSKVKTELLKQHTKFYGNQLSEATCREEQTDDEQTNTQKHWFMSRMTGYVLLWIAEFCSQSYLHVMFKDFFIDLILVTVFCRCCNTCDDVKEAYRLKRWALPDLATIEQCKNDESRESSDRALKEGCHIYGYMEVNRVRRPK